MDPLRHIIRFAGLVLLQVLVLNNILFYGYLNPYVYVLFILLLPQQTSRGWLLILAFLMGACIDLFENSGGVHIAATVALAWLRPVLLRTATRKRGTDFEELRIDRLGLSSRITYTGLAVFIHHFLLFALEAYRLADLGTVLVRSFVSSIFTAVFILILQLWQMQKKD